MALLYEEQSYAILGACFEVYKEKGCGFVEPVYHQCLRIEFRLQGIPSISKPKLLLSYKGVELEGTYEADFVCYGQIIVEIKAVSKLVEEHRAQLHNYLKATGHRLGLLVNFGHHPQLQHERIVR